MPPSSRSAAHCAAAGRFRLHRAPVAFSRSSTGGTKSWTCSRRRPPRCSRSRASLLALGSSCGGAATCAGSASLGCSAGAGELPIAFATLCSVCFMLSNRPAFNAGSPDAGPTAKIDQGRSQGQMQCRSCAGAPCTETVAPPAEELSRAAARTALAPNFAWPRTAASMAA